MDDTGSRLPIPARHGQNERAMALRRKNALFAGSDGGAEHWATVASLIENCKLNDIDPLAYPTDVLTRVVNGHPNRDIDQLLPWAYK
jgi:transposase